MKVLPLILTLLILLSVALREELRNFRTVKEGRISSVEQIINFREKNWAPEDEKEPIIKNNETSSESKSSVPRLATNTVKGLPRELNIYALIDPDEFASHPDEGRLLLQIVEKLLSKQFQESPLYKALIDDDPQLVSHLFEAVREQFPSMEFNIGKMGWKELSLIQLENEKLQLFFYEILKGEKMRTHKLEKSFMKGEQIPLLNALRVEKSRKRKTRLFTASPSLLEALVSEPKQLATLLEKRRVIWRENQNSKSKNDELGKEGKSLLQKRWEEAVKEAGIELPEELVSYELSTTPL